MLNDFASNPFVQKGLVPAGFMKMARVRHSLIAIVSAAALASLATLTGCNREKQPAVQDNPSASTQAALSSTTNSNSPVTTENPGYNRTTSHVLVRRITEPTAANLDYAAYAQNVMLHDPEPFEVQPAQKITLADLRFMGLALEARANLDGTALTAKEKAHLIAFTPALDRLLQWNFSAVAPFADAYSKLTGEKWGDTSDVPVAYQEIAALVIHAAGEKTEVWAKVEFKPFMAAHLNGIGAGAEPFAEAWLRLNPEKFTQAMADELLGEYSQKLLDPEAVQDWARNLTSRWYPSYNTDLVEVKPGQPWPYADAPESVKKELGGFQVPAPTVIFKGRPFEDTLFNVFVVTTEKSESSTGTSASASAAAVQANGQSETGMPRQVDTRAAARAKSIADSVNAQLRSLGGGSYATWEGKLKKFHQGLRTFAQSEPTQVQGLLGLALGTRSSQVTPGERFLVFRREIDYLLAPDWQSEQAKNHPMPIIVALQQKLAAQGIDFLFVPIPTKIDLYPEVMGPAASSLPGGIAQPYGRKVLADLGQAGIETVDLLAPFLAAKSQAGQGAVVGKTLYQQQDTHWSNEGLRLAAKVLAERIRGYSWYAPTFAPTQQQAPKFTYQDTTYAAFGDIQARLSDKVKSEVKPESLTARRVFMDGKPYTDQENSPVLVLGDSYTGVFQSIGCRNAGVTAHLAAELQGPVDLIMGWGGGPEAPRKLEKRGDAYLQTKRLVVWMMSARDLFAYSGEWK